MGRLLLSETDNLEENKVFLKRYMLIEKQEQLKEWRGKQAVLTKTRTEARPQEYSIKETKNRETH